jgi:hypothetical protein
MLMLNPSTLHYMNLSRNNTTQKNVGLIKDWTSTVSKLTSKPSSTAGSSRTFGSVPRSTTQAPSQCSTTSMKKVIAPPVLPDDDIEPNGLSNHDETIGKERDAAVNSPRKNGVRATSSVSTTRSSFIYYTYTISNSIGHGEGHHLRA